MSKSRDPHASSRPAPRTAHPGGAGGISEFAPGVDLMFSFSLRSGDRPGALRARLDVAALVRRSPQTQSSRARAASAAQADGLARPPPNAGQGGGGSVGSHQLYCDRENELLLLDGQPLISLRGINIVLLVEADDSLNVAATDTVEADLGEVRVPSASGPLGFPGAIRKAIAQSRAARDFLSPR